MPDWRGLVAVRALDHMLVSPVGDIYDVPTDSTGHDVPLGSILRTVGWRQLIPRLDVVRK